MKIFVLLNNHFKGILCLFCFSISVQVLAHSWAWLLLTGTALWPRTADRDPGRAPCSSCPGSSGATGGRRAAPHRANRCGPSASDCHSRRSWPSCWRCDGCGCCCRKTRTKTSTTRRRTRTMTMRIASQWHCQRPHVLVAACGRTTCTPRWVCGSRLSTRCCI